MTGVYIAAAHSVQHSSLHFIMGNLSHFFHMLVVVSVLQYHGYQHQRTDAEDSGPKAAALPEYNQPTQAACEAKSEATNADYHGTNERQLHKVFKPNPIVLLEVTDLLPVC